MLLVASQNKTSMIVRFSQNRCKRPCWRSISFWGWLTFTFKVKFNFKVKICDNSSPVQARFTKLGPRVQNILLRSLLFWGLIRLDRSNLTLFKNPVYLHRFCVFKLFLGHTKAESDALFHIPHGSAHMLIPICKPNGSLHGPWTSLA